MSKTLQRASLSVLLLVVTTVSALTPYKNFLDDVEASSKKIKHLGKGLKKVKNDFETLNLLYSSSGSDCVDYYTFYIKELFTPQVIVKNDFKCDQCEPQNYILDDGNSEIFLFVHDWRDFNNTFGPFATSKFFRNLSRYKIILCHPAITDDYAILHGLAEIVWSKKILNFVFYFYNTKQNRVAQYNPFTGHLKVVSLGNVPGGFEEYPDKLKDINGYPLRILNYPNYVDDEYLLFDFVNNFQKALKRSLNATLLFRNIDLDKSNVFNIFKYISNTDVDLCLQPQAISWRNIPLAYVNKIDFSNPHLMNNLVVLVPKPKIVKKWSYIISNFVKGSILLLFLMSFIVAQIDQFLIKGGLDIEYFLLAALKVPMARAIKKKTTTRASWLIFLLFFGILVDNSYLKTILSDKFEQDIITNEDLVRSGLKVYAAQFKNYNPKSVNLSFSYILVNKSTWKTLLFQNDGETAFVGSYIELDRIMKYFAKRRIYFRYHYLRDMALPKFGSLVMKMRSPFLRKVGALATKAMEFGVSGLVPYKTKEIPVSDVLITFEHFMGVNIILSVGLTVASAVFVAELYWNRCRRILKVWSCTE